LLAMGIFVFIWLLIATNVKKKKDSESAS
jgi:hypothetical protein